MTVRDTLTGRICPFRCVSERSAGERVLHGNEHATPLQPRTLSEEGLSSVEPRNRRCGRWQGARQRCLSLTQQGLAPWRGRCPLQSPQSLQSSLELRRGDCGESGECGSRSSHPVPPVLRRLESEGKKLPGQVDKLEHRDAAADRSEPEGPVRAVALLGPSGSTLNLYTQSQSRSPEQAVRR